MTSLLKQKPRHAANKRFLTVSAFSLLLIALVGPSASAMDPDGQSVYPNGSGGGYGGGYSHPGSGGPNGGLQPGRPIEYTREQQQQAREAKERAEAAAKADFEKVMNEVIPESVAALAKFMEVFETEDVKFLVETF